MSKGAGQTLCEQICVQGKFYLFYLTEIMSINCEFESCQQSKREVRPLSDDHESCQQSKREVRPLSDDQSFKHSN